MEFLKQAKKFYKSGDYKSSLIFIKMFEEFCPEIASVVKLNKMILQEKVAIENKENNVYVSVIVPVYNAEKYLRETLSYIINQTLKNIEIILVDDGSTDNSDEILNEFKKKDRRISIITQDNHGAGVARNTGIAAASGEYLSFLDADDIFHPEMLEKAYNYAKLKNADIVFWKAGIRNHEGTVYHNLWKPQFNDAENINFCNDKYKYHEITNPVPWNKLIRHDLIKKHNILYQNLSSCNDIAFIWLAIEMSTATFYLNKELCEYRNQNIGSISKTRYQNANNIIEAGKYILKFFEGKKYNYNKNRLYDSIVHNFCYEYQQFPKDIEVKNFLADVYDFLPQKFRVKFNHIIYKVSVIVPVYNVEKYLEQCLESLVGQTLKDIEIICVDDGSTDSSPDILKKYEKKDNRIKVIYQKNKGPGAARNLGVRAASGLFIFFIDSDDWVDKTCLEKLYGKSMSSGADVCLYGLNRFDQEKNIVISDQYYDTSCYQTRNIETCRYNDIKKFIFRRFSAFLKLYETSFFKDNDLYFSEEIILGEDVLTHVKSLIYAEKISFLDENLYFYRFNRADSIMNCTSKEGENFSGIFVYLSEVKKFLCQENKYDELEHEYLLFVFEQIRYHLGRYTGNSQYALKNKAVDFVVGLNVQNSKFYDIIHSYHQLVSSSQGAVSIGNNPFVSIIIPTYNCEKYLKKCIDSVLNQTLEHIEIICVNDGSIDGTKDILKKYESLDKRFRPVYRNNSGPGASRNAALEMAKGEFIQFVDADDWIESKTSEYLYSFAVKHDLEMLSFSGWNYNNGRSEVNPYWEYKNIPESKLNVPLNTEEISCYCSSLPVSSCLTIYNSEFIRNNQIKFPEGLIFEDNVFFTKSILRCTKFAVVKEYFYNRLIRHGQITKRTSRSVFDIFEIYGMCILEYKKHKGQDGANEFAIKKLNHIIDIYGKLDMELKKEYEQKIILYIDTYIHTMKGLNILSAKTKSILSPILKKSKSY